MMEIKHHAKKFWFSVFEIFQTMWNSEKNLKNYSDKKYIALFQYVSVVPEKIFSSIGSVWTEL